MAYKTYQVEINCKEISCTTCGNIEFFTSGHLSINSANILWMSPLWSKNDIFRCTCTECGEIRQYSFKIGKINTILVRKY